MIADPWRMCTERICSAREVVIMVDDAMLASRPFLHPLPPSEDIARIQTARACTNGTRRHMHIHTNITEVCILHKKWRPVFVSKKPHSSVFDTNGLDWAFLENADARTVELHLVTRSLAPIFLRPLCPQTHLALSIGWKHT